MQFNPDNYGTYLYSYNPYPENNIQKSKLYCYEELEPEFPESKPLEIHNEKIEPKSKESESHGMDYEVSQAQTSADMSVLKSEPETCRQTLTKTESQESRLEPEDMQSMMETEFESTTNSQEEFSVNVLNINQFLSSIIDNTHTSPQDRFEKLKSLFTYIPANGENLNAYWNLWLEIPKDNKTIYIDLIMVEEQYESQCLAESVIHKDPTLLKSLFIKASVENDAKTFYFNIRIEPSFFSSEILHIQQAETLTGNEVKKLCMDFLNYIKPSYIYLHDDAYKEDIDHSKTALRVFLPIVNDQPKTWYSTDGFELAEFEDLTNIDGLQKPPQNQQAYTSSVNLIRNTLLKDLSKSTGFYSKSTIETWINKYLNSNKAITYLNCSVHELGKAMYLALRDNNNKKLSKEAETDFKNFYKHYLERTPLLPTKYREALFVLESYQLWFKTT